MKVNVSDPHINFSKNTESGVAELNNGPHINFSKNTESGVVEPNNRGISPDFVVYDEPTRSESANVLAGRIKKKYDFRGKQKFVSTPLSFSGGVGAGVLTVELMNDMFSKLQSIKPSKGSVSIIGTPPKEINGNFSI